MSEERSISNAAVGPPSPAGVTGQVAAFAILLNVVTAGLGGLYITTQSIAVTAVAAGLVALLGLYVAFSCGHHR